MGVCRAFGDFDYKSNQDLQPEKQAVIALPEITVFKRQKDDELIVLACDGIWNCLSNQECLQFLNSKLNQIKKSRDFMTKLSSPFQDLFDQIVAKQIENDDASSLMGTDNMTAILIILDE